MAEFTTSLNGRIYAYGRVTLPVLRNSLGRFPQGSDNRWGELQWYQILPDGDAFTQVDVLDANGSVLLSNATQRLVETIQVEGEMWSIMGTHLEQIKEVGSRDIRIRFTLFMINQSPKIRFINLGFVSPT